MEKEKQEEIVREIRTAVAGRNSAAWDMHLAQLAYDSARVLKCWLYFSTSLSFRPEASELYLMRLRETSVVWGTQFSVATITTTTAALL